MKKRLEWKKCADSGTSEKSGSHGLYWGTRVPLPAFNSFSPTFLCSVFLTRVLGGRDVFLFILWLNLNNFLFVCFFNNLNKNYLCVNGPGYWTKTGSLCKKNMLISPTFVLICVISMCTGVLQRWVLLHCNVRRCGLCLFSNIVSKLKFCNNLGRPRPCEFVYSKARRTRRGPPRNDY